MSPAAGWGRPLLLEVCDLPKGLSSLDERTMRCRRAHKVAARDRRPPNAGVCAGPGGLQWRVESKLPCGSSNSGVCLTILIKADPCLPGQYPAHSMLVLRLSQY